MIRKRVFLLQTKRCQQQSSGNDDSDTSTCTSSGCCSDGLPLFYQQQKNKTTQQERLVLLVKWNAQLICSFFFLLLFIVLGQQKQQQQQHIVVVESFTVQFPSSSLLLSHRSTKRNRNSNKNNENSSNSIRCLDHSSSKRQQGALFLPIFVVPKRQEQDEPKQAQEQPQPLLSLSQSSNNHHSARHGLIKSDEESEDNATSDEILITTTSWKTASNETKQQQQQQVVSGVVTKKKNILDEKYNDEKEDTTNNVYQSNDNGNDDNDYYDSSLVKKEERGDREQIIRQIHQFQNDVSYQKKEMDRSPLTLLPFDTIYDRFLDTIEDIFLHLRRLPYDYGWIPEEDHEEEEEDNHFLEEEQQQQQQQDNVVDATTPQVVDTTDAGDVPIQDTEQQQLDRSHWKDTKKKKKKQKKKVVVVLGSGWAAHAYLKVADTYQQRIIVVSPMNHFVFTPMLASAAVGTVEYRSMTEAIRLSNPMIENYMEGFATDINVQEQIITIQLKPIVSTTSTLSLSSATSSKATSQNDHHRTRKEQLALEPRLTSPAPTTTNNILTIQYDQLIVAVGCKVADSRVPGAKEYALRLKSCDDARILRTHVGEAFEYASRPDVVATPITKTTTTTKTNVKKSDSRQQLEQSQIQTELLQQEQQQQRMIERQRRVTFCIVGGGPTGVELAGELIDFVQDICKPRTGAYPDLRSDVRIILIHGGERLVQQFDTELSKNAQLALTRAGVEIRLQTQVQEVGPDYVKIRTKRNKNDPNDSSSSSSNTVDNVVLETIPCGVCVWAAGTEPVPFVQTLLEKLPSNAKAPDGKIHVDPWLRCPMPSKDLLGTILVMGDAASFVDTQQTTTTKSTTPFSEYDNKDKDRKLVYLPQTAQVAAQQGAYAARLVDRNYNLSVTPPILSPPPQPQLLQDITIINFGTWWLQLRGLEKADGFKFLNLGLLAYIGGGQALSQVQLGKVLLASYSGSTAFVLWRSVYLVKQVATRNRILITFDWIKSAIFGRDITRL